MNRMKVKVINSGGVYHAPKGFQFSLIVDGIEIRNSNLYSSASECEQAMREKVHLLRKQHAIG